jgi:hypothetical protein
VEVDMKSQASIMGLIAALAGGIAIFLVQLQGGGNLDGVLPEPRTAIPQATPAPPPRSLLVEPTDTPAEQPPSSDANKRYIDDTNNEGINWAQLIVSSILGAILSGVVGTLTPIAINRFIPRLEKV